MTITSTIIEDMHNNLTDEEIIKKNSLSPFFSAVNLKRLREGNGKKIKGYNTVFISGDIEKAKSELYRKYGFNNICKIEDAQLINLNSYTNQKVLILDNFESLCPVKVLLNLQNNFKPVSCICSKDLSLTYTKIFVLSKSPLEEIYPSLKEERMTKVEKLQRKTLDDNFETVLNYRKDGKIETIKKHGK